MNKKAAVRIIKEAENTKKKIIYKRQRAYFKPFFVENKEFAEVSVKYAVEFSVALDILLKNYQEKCIKAISGKVIFCNRDSVQKAKKYKTHEYLDERHNNVVVDDIKDTLVVLNESFKKGISESYSKYITNGHVRDGAELVYKDLGIAFNFNKFNEKASSYLNDKEIKWSKEVAKDTEKLIKKELVKGFEAGSSTYDIAENIRSASGFSYSRSESIARTEIMASRNYVKFMGQMDDPNVIGSQWSSAYDDRTRPTHKAADGQKRKKGEPFDVGGYKLLFPGDSSLGAPAGEVISCRCSLVDVLKGEPLDSKTVYDDEDAGSKEWLERQSNKFQEEYSGGKTKKELIRVGLLDIKDRENPLDEILDEIYPVKLKAADIMRVSDLPEVAINEVIKRANELWLFGKFNNKEANVTLKAETGKKAFKNVVGEEGRIKEDSDNAPEWLEYLEKAKLDSVILAHNHNDNTPISVRDLLTLLEYKSINSIFAVDINGNLYFIEKISGIVYDIGKIKEKYAKYLEELAKLPEEKRENMIKNKELLKKINTRIVYKLCQQFKVKLGRFEQ